MTKFDYWYLIFGPFRKKIAIAPLWFFPAIFVIGLKRAKIKLGDNAYGGKNQLYPILINDPSFCLSWWVEQEK